MKLLGSDEHAALGALMRIIGVYGGRDKWLIGSIIANPLFAGWLDFMLEKLYANYDRIVGASGYERVRIVGEIVSAAAREWQAKSYEEKIARGKEAIARLEMIAERIKAMLGPVAAVKQLLAPAV